MVKYLLFFCVGAGSGYFLSTLTTPSETLNSPVMNANQTMIKPSLIPQETVVEPQLSDNKTLLVEASQLTSSEKMMFSKEISALKAQNQALENKYQHTNNRLMSLTLELESLDESDISDQKMMALINDDFAEYRRGFRGKQRDNIFELHNEVEDLDWGYKMTTQLTDYIQTHYHSNSIILQGVTCKINRCELLISEREAGIWSLVIKEMTQQPWWQFSSTHSSSSSADDEMKSFYLLMSS